MCKGVSKILVFFLPWKVTRHHLPPCSGWWENFVCLPQKVLSVLLESCVCLFYWEILSICVFLYVCNYCLNMELRQKWIRYFSCFCCHHLPVTTTTRVGFMAGAQNLSLSSLITRFKLAGVQISFWCSHFVIFYFIGNMILELGKTFSSLDSKVFSMHCIS